MRPVGPIRFILYLLTDVVSSHTLVYEWTNLTGMSSKTVLSFDFWTTW